MTVVEKSRSIRWLCLPSHFKIISLSSLLSSVGIQTCLGIRSVPDHQWHPCPDVFLCRLRSFMVFHAVSDYYNRTCRHLCHRTIRHDGRCLQWQLFEHLYVQLGYCSESPGRRGHQSPLQLFSRTTLLLLCHAQSMVCAESSGGIHNRSSS